MLDAGEYSSSSSAECPMSSFNTSVVCSILNLKTKDSKNNKRRFSDEQIKSLESIFDTDTKLEPKKKLLLARQLGLQPRQVAIWFQNKRARWKSKQLQRDYNLLQSNYDDLASQFEILKKGRQTLIHQLQKLRNDLIGKSDEIEAAGHESFRDEASDDDGPGNSFGCGLENDDPNGAAIANMIRSSCAGDQHDVNKKPSVFLNLERTGYGILNGVLSDDDGINNDSRNPEIYLGLEAEAAAELPLNTVEPADGCNLTQHEEWGSLEQPSDGYKWWGDIWP